MALTTIGVIVGILTIVTMVSLGIGVQYEMRKSFGSVEKNWLANSPTRMYTIWFVFIDT